MTNPAAFRVGVVGAGLGGLCLAQGLTRAGIGVTVYERDAAAATREQGYRISLKRTGASALAACLPPHLFRLCVATAIQPATRLIVADERLDPTFTKPLPAHPPGPAGFGVNRQTLREILLSGLDVRFGATLRRYEPSPDGVVARFADGTSATVDLLVGADGTSSAVRRQLVPDAVIDELHWAAYGRTPLTARTLHWLPRILTDSFNRISAGDGSAFAVATCRTREPVAAAAARLAPDVHLTDIPPYLQWTVMLPEPPSVTSPAGLHRLAAGTLSAYHPAVRRIVAEADIEATFAVRVASARPVRRWTAPAVTLLGDAVHTMSPGRGDGANIALRDAQVLRDELRDAAAGRKDLVAAKQDYEAAMLGYGFAAVAASRDRPFLAPVSAADATGPADAATGWERFAAVHAVGDVLDVTVTRHLPVGALVDIAPGVAGILLGGNPPIGARVAARVHEIDHANRRAGLTPI